MFLGNWRNNQCGMKANQCGSQRAEFGIPSAYFELLCNVSVQLLMILRPRAYPSPNSVRNVASPTLHILASIGDDDLQVGILIQNLLNTAFVGPLLPWNMLLRVFIVIA